MASLDDTHESSPLLGDARPRDVNDEHLPKARYIQQHFGKWRTLYICALFLIATDVPSFMGEGTMLRMFELGVCREYYSTNDPSAIGDGRYIPEDLCKLREIQSKVAKMRGIFAFMEAIPGLVLAVPYGILADKKGRGLVLGLCLAGFIARDIWIFISLYFYQVFPLKAVYLAPLTAIIGGGSTVTGPMFLAIVAASTPQESRTQAFFMVQVCFILLEFVSPPIGSILMETVGPYYAWLAGIPLGLFGFACLPFLPKNKQIEAAEPSATSEPIEEQSRLATTVLGRMKQWLTRFIQYLRRDVIKIFYSRQLLVGLLAMLVAKMARPVREIISQFMTAKFKWPISQTNMLLSLQAAAQLPLFVAILPAANAWLFRWKRDSIKASRILAIVLVCCLALGAFCMGLAPTPLSFIFAVVIYTGGSGFSATMRALLTSLVSDDHLSLLFTSITVFEAVALLTAAPLLQMIFSWGLQVGGLMTSLPFLVVAVLYGCAAMALLLCKFVSQKSDLV